ncbi:MAG: single-stranded DNA-binding protein [Fibrobacterota bacterium]
MPERKLPALNKVLIVGNLTKEPELRQTGTGTPVANFRIASSRRFRGSSGEWKEEVCYIGVVSWQKLAENCASHLKKGSAVLVEGELQSRSWETEDGSKRSTIEIHAHKVQFLDKKHEKDEDQNEDGPDTFYHEFE